MAPLTERFEMRLDEETIQAIDRWRFARGGSRAEAARKLIAIGLAAGADDNDKPARPASPYSKGEKLALFMLCDIVDALKVKEPGIDPAFVRSAMGGGHYWGLEWQYDGVFRDDEPSKEDVDFVADVLDMWDTIELAAEDFDRAEKENIKAEAPIGDLLFRGFDGNTEGRYMSIARFLTRDLQRFERFKTRSLNSHLPHSAEGYRRMLPLFAALRPPALRNRKLTSDQVIEILKERAQPEASK